VTQRVSCKRVAEAWGEGGREGMLWRVQTALNILRLGLVIFHI
jgi:hypothetical protein